MLVQSIFDLRLLTSIVFCMLATANKPDQQIEVQDSSSEEILECVSVEKLGSSDRTIMAELIHVDFEVDGIVQGVFFRKHTQTEGNKLGLRGFCRNTRAGTVSGSMEGPRPAVDKMKYWLQHTGSPMSKISSAAFTNEKVIDSYTFPEGFDIKRTV